MAILERTMTTISAKAVDVERKWYVVDLEGKTLGKAAVAIAHILRGKHKAIYTPHVDTGDFIIAINADKLRVTGNKLTQKTYYHHSGYPGGIKEIKLDEQLNKAPERVIYGAVRGMLPKTKLGRQMLKKFKVYTTAEHPHEAQKPEALNL
jgi:large subunit ribosomal protein L13